MKNQFPLVFLLIFVFLVSGCTAPSTAVSTAISPAAPTESPATESASVEDEAGLIAALHTSGATVETGEPVSQPFFTPEASIIKVNGADVQVFEYESAEVMESEASQVSSDGGSIGTSMVSWMDTPHFYKTGKIIVLYVGSDPTVLEPLEGVLGPQFAGG
jgi:hypothetical protein